MVWKCSASVLRTPHFWKVLNHSAVKNCIFLHSRFREASVCVSIRAFLLEERWMQTIELDWCIDCRGFISQCGLPVDDAIFQWGLNHWSIILWTRTLSWSRISLDLGRKCSFWGTRSFQNDLQCSRKLFFVKKHYGKSYFRILKTFSTRSRQQARGYLFLI